MGKAVWSSAGHHEFRIVKKGAASICVGVAAVNALEAKPWVKGIVLGLHGEARPCIVTNPVGNIGSMRLDVHSVRFGYDSIVDVRIEAGRLFTSCNGGQFVDHEVELPEKVSPWVAMIEPNDECEFHMIPRKALQLVARAEGLGLTVTCTNLAGERLIELANICPNNQFSAFADMLRHRIPSPLGTGWLFVLPDGKCSSDAQLNVTLSDLFGLWPVSN